MSKKNNFGENLRKIRKHYGINLTQMADQLGIVKSNLSRYERNLNKPTIYFLELLLKHYKVNLNWLFGVKENMILGENDTISLSQLPQGEYINEQEPLSKVIELPAMTFTSFGVPVFEELIDNISSTDHLFPVSGQISAGEPLPIFEADSSNFVSFPLFKSNHDFDNYLVFRVNGLSMKPEIEHEDIVFIYKNNDWYSLNGKIVAVNIEGSMTLKKLYVNEANKEIVFKALNKRYDDINISFEMMGSTYLVGELKAIRRVYNNK